MNYYKLIILTFTITALWDVCLRFMALNYEKLPKIINSMMPFIKDLKPYFQNILYCCSINSRIRRCYNTAYHLKDNTIS